MPILGFRPHRRALRALGPVIAVIAITIATLSSVADAAEAPVNLGTAASFGVLAGAGVTNTGPTTVARDLGTCPTTSVTGFPPGTVGGTIHAGGAVACNAQSDLTIAYNAAAGRAATTTYPGPTELGGRTLTSGVYNSPTSFAITGTLTLDAQGDSTAAFIFQAGSTLITAPNSSVVVVNAAQECNVFWQVGSSATLGVGSTLRGSVLALTSITANTTAVVRGRLLARNGAVTLDSNTIASPSCATTPTPTASTSTTPTTAAPPTTAATPTSSPTPTTATATPTTATATPTTATPTATTQPAPPLTAAAPPLTAAAPQPSVGAAMLNPLQAAPGQAVGVSGGGFDPGAPLQATLAGASVGTGRADLQGNFAIIFVVPGGLGAGTHQVVITGVGAGGEQRRSTASLHVAASATSLPHTGTALNIIVTALALVCLGSGHALRVLARRR